MRYRKIFFTVFLIPLFIIFSNPTYAKTKVFDDLEVSPIIQTLNLNKGDTFRGFITLINKAQEKKYIVIGISGFRQYGQSNTPKFSRKINASSHSIHWFTIQNSVTLNPYQEEKIPYSIYVPHNAAAGGHFAAIVVDERNSKSKIIESIRPLFIINIAGKIQFTGFVKKFSTEKLFNYSGKINFNTTFQNTGNIEFAPYGFIIIKNIFGQLVGVINVNKDKSLDLPQSTRLYKSKFVDNSFFNTGMYSAQLILSYGNTSKIYNTNKSTTFYIINPEFLTILIIIFISIIIYISYTRKK